MYNYIHINIYGKIPLLELFSFPLNVPKEYLLDDVHEDDEDQCATYTDFIYPGGETDKKVFQCRTILQSQVNLLDIIVGQIVNKIKENRLWDNTLLVFSTDNVECCCSLHFK